MFTVIAQKSQAEAEKYFDEHLEQNDYYSAGEIRPGQWIGASADRLGLKQNVTREQFHALCENRNPLNDDRLTQRQKKEDKRRVFYDFTCSAPKSVSVLAVTLDDDRLVTAHEEAARIAFRELEPLRQRGRESMVTSATAPPAIWSPLRSRTRAAARSTRSCTRISRCSTRRLITANSAGKPYKRAECMMRFVTARWSIETNWRNRFNKLRIPGSVGQ